MPMTKDTAGDEAALVLQPGNGVISGTTPVFTILDVRDKDAVSLQLIVDYQVDTITVIGAADHVVASTGVWTFGNYTFTGLTGAKLVISGATNAGNNGTFAITGVSGHTATTATTGLVDETFAASVTAQVIRSETASHPAGAWTVLASNDYVPGAAGSSSGAYGAPANPGHFFSVTALFSKPTTIAAVTDANAQYVQADPHFDGRHLKVIFTPSGGAGTASVSPYRKNWSR